MAALATKPAPGNWEIASGQTSADFKRHDEQLAEFMKASSKVDTNVSLVNAIIQLPFADGAAIYRVSKDKPLTLQHVPCLDAWQVPYAHIRGLRRTDIIRMVEGDRRMADLFSGK